MPLTAEQIERYSRQIIVPGIGGLAQERLLAARLLICGEVRDAETALAYMAGAGVGTIEVAFASPEPDFDAIASSMRALNSDSRVTLWRDDSAPPDAILAVAATASALELIAPLVARFKSIPWVAARLDDRPRIAVLPAPPPCPRCAGEVLLAEFESRADTADIVVMAAAGEVLKLLAGYQENPRPALIEFDGYDSRSREILRDPGCDCGGKGT